MRCGLAAASRAGVAPLSRLRATGRAHPIAADIVMVVVLCSVTLLAAATGPGFHTGKSLHVALALAVVAYGALLFRRRWPYPVLAVAIAAAEGYMALRRGEVWVQAAPIVALYTVADTMQRRRVSLAIGWMTVGLLATAHALVNAHWLGPENLTLAALGALAIAAGDASRTRRAYAAEVEERARRAEDNREQEARRRVTEERLRIARELHDILGHRIALINVQAGVASRVFDDQPDKARQALAQVRHTGRTILDELRDAIGLLRQPDEPNAPTTPIVSGIADLGELIASFAAAGVRVSLDICGSVRPIPRAEDLTAYRVIQESLTNVRKHAGNANVLIRLTFMPEELRILIEDDGPPGSQPGRAPADVRGTRVDGSGHGVIGMCERVAALGGRLVAEPRTGKGFQVYATLPLPLEDPT
jgi:signal transduction histidine kinase